MKDAHKPIGFPLTVGVVTDPGTSVSEDALAAARQVFKKLQERSRFGVLVILREHTAQSKLIDAAASDAGIDYRTLEIAGRPGVKSTGGPLTAANMELVETTDVLILIAPTAAGSGNGQHDALLAYARDESRLTVCIDAETGKIVGEMPQQLAADQGWLPELFQLAGLTAASDLPTIKERMSAVANRAAPVTRRSWSWILCLQGLVVLLPLMWLVRRQAGIAIWAVAVPIFCSVVLVIAVNWWLRYRGMQKTWAQARLVAEVARSLIATEDAPDYNPWSVLKVVPALRPVRWIARRSQQNVSFTAWRDRYVKNRIDDQQNYFSSKQKQAEIERKRLSRWSTKLLDVALAFAFAGFAIAIVPRAWVQALGGARVEVILGLAGVAMPLGLLLIQILRDVQELNRRTARFARQRQMLDQARASLMSLPGAGAAAEVIQNTEQELLGEVLEWYFQAETAEHFFQARRTRTAARKLRLKPEETTSQRVALAVLRKTGSAGEFVLDVIFGRLVWIVGTAAVLIIWINYFPLNQVSESELEKNVVIDWRPWNPSGHRADNGCIILVHGLYGSLSPGAEKTDWEKKAWMKNCAEAICEKLGDKAPNIGLVDWSFPAHPSVANRSRIGLQPFDVLGDISGVRPQAQRVGDVLAKELALLITRDKVIRPDQPLHLIGHSAGGFVVARAAIDLCKRGQAPTPMRVTILDTPAPDEEILNDLPNRCDADFYITSPVGGEMIVDSAVKAGIVLLRSGKAWALPDMTSSKLNWKIIRVKPKLNMIEAHQEAYIWYQKTINDPFGPESQGEGFRRSPVMSRLQASRP